MKTDGLHPGQIPTTRAAIRRELWDKGYSVITALLKCVSLAPDSCAFVNQAVVAASLLERVSCLVYKGKDGSRRKLPEKAYKKAIFEAYAETEDEVAFRLGEQAGDAKRAFKTLWRIADLVCPMMACVTEQAFVSEYAYAIEYAARHGGDLPKPEIGTLFPTNYPDYDCTQGVAALIREAAGTIICKKKRRICAAFSCKCTENRTSCCVESERKTKGHDLKMLAESEVEEETNES